MPRSVALALLPLLLAPALARAQPPRLVLRQRLVGMVNPMGAEHALSLGMRAPIGDPRELLFTGAHAELGVSSYVSPIDARAGGYLQLSPVAFLVLRAEVLGAGTWPIGMEGAGNVAVDGYGAALGPPQLAADRALLAGGWNVQLSAIVQGAVPIGPGRLIVWNQAMVERLRLGDAAFSYHPRYDAILAREDWVVTNHAMLLGEVPLAPGLALRAGAYDELRLVPRSDDLVHQLGAVAMLRIDAPAEGVGEIIPFVRVGGFTEGRRAAELTALAALFVRYDP